MRAQPQNYSSVETNFMVQGVPDLPSALVILKYSICVVDSKSSPPPRMHEVLNMALKI